MPLQMLRERPRIKTVLAVAAGKGGVGKSTVAVNLARALKKSGHTVGLMDTDVYGPSVRRMLPEDRMPAQKGEKFLPALSDGIRVISMAYFRKEGEASAVRAPIANGIVTQFIQQVEWGDLDYLLIDFPPGTGDVQLTLSQKANLTGAIMVTTPQEIAVMDVKKAMDMFRMVKVPIVGIIENMSGYHHEGTGETFHLFGKGGGERLSKGTGHPFLGNIPIDPEISRSSDEGQSLFSQEELPAAAQAFMEIADRVRKEVKALEAESGGNPASFELTWQEMG